MPDDFQAQATADTSTDDDVTLRDTIDAAFEAAATNEPKTATEPEAEATESTRARDERGRFARQEAGEGAGAGTAPAASPAPAQAPSQAIAAAPAPAAPEVKAPAAWKPEAREHWAQVPPSIQAEVARREREYQQTLQSAAGQRQFVEAFENAVRPYEVFIRQENSNPIQAMVNMFQTAATLRVGTPMEKARIAADIVNNFGVDLVTLDKLLAGQQVQPHEVPQQAQQFRDPRVDQLLMQQAIQARDRESFENEAIAQGLQKFAATHEFYNDVRDVMADLVERASRRGEAVDLEKIYARACQLDESVSTILAQRTAAARQGQQSQAVLRARRAASSVRSQPSPEGATVPKDDSVRAAVEAAFESAATR